MGKYDRYFIFETPRNPLHPESSDMDSEKEQITTMYINDELDQTIKGAFYMETNFVVRESEIQDASDKRLVKPHNHDFIEYMLFLGTDPENPHDLGAEVELWLEDEKHVFDKTCTVFIPKLMYHCPFIVRNLERPFIWVTTSDALQYRSKSYTTDPKWADYAVLPPEVVNRLPDWARKDGELD